MPKKSSGLLSSVNNACMPAYLYFYISVVTIIILAIQNIGNKHAFCAGPYECSVPDTTLVFIIQLLYVVFWTWVLASICRLGYTKVAWFIFLLPVILMFLGLLILLFR